MMASVSARRVPGRLTGLDSTQLRLERRQNRIISSWRPGRIRWFTPCFQQVAGYPVGDRRVAVGLTWDELAVTRVGTCDTPLQGRAVKREQILLGSRPRVAAVAGVFDRLLRQGQQMIVEDTGAG